MRTIACLLITGLIVTSTPVAFAQTPSVYAVELVVTEGKKSVETDADITFGDSTVRVEPDKQNYKGSSKEFAYSEIKNVDYSYAKKPMLSGGGAIATALLVGFIVAIPLLFIKKKKHWMVMQTENDFAVVKLGDRNHRQIVAELRAKGVTVNDLKEEGK